MENQQIGTCLIAFALLGSSLYTMLNCAECDPFKSYQDSLSPELAQLYNQVKEERVTIYLQGLVLGTLSALAYIWFWRGNLNPLANSCIFTSIAMGVQYLYYALMPKKYHMLPNLESPEQVHNWYLVYKHMKKKGHLGMLLGVLGFLLLSTLF